METFKGIVYFIWLVLFSSSSLAYGEVQSSSSYHQNSRITPFLQNILLSEDRDNGKLYTTNIFLAQNEQTGAGRRRANDLARRKQAKRKKTKNLQFNQNTKAAKTKTSLH